MKLRNYQEEDVLKMLSNDCIGNFSEVEDAIESQVDDEFGVIRELFGCGGAT